MWSMYHTSTNSESIVTIKTITYSNIKLWLNYSQYYLSELLIEKIKHLFTSQIQEFNSAAMDGAVLSSWLFLGHTVCCVTSFPLLETPGGCSAAPYATIYGSGNPQMQLLQEIFIIWQKW